MCGEKNQGFLIAMRLKGSPPRVRGKAAANPVHSAFDRITPACAGKSGGRNPSFRGIKDHPRVCGEKFHRSKTSSRVMGSPPRVRGKVEQISICFSIPRITPACAGKSIRISGKLLLLQDHPRVCGEKRIVQFRFGSMPGSPPRVRGKVSDGNDVPECGRITPACAGKR